MGLLDQLWDETVAGPRPDHGLGRLRKYSSFSPSTAAAADVAPAVTRSITIARPPSLSVPSGESSSVPPSPASAPDSPFAAVLIDRDRFCWIGDASLVPRARCSHIIRSVTTVPVAEMSGNLLLNLKFPSLN
ncbi:dormancy-associated protein homolog 3-like isoform X1 [Triticum dicoccoides]|uniref:dormancy-associated protein homolog 3-like isoform X1 n=1 Tax=Triticum dicoccoides TaxID=85692 RepID=UPI000E7959AC|nr:dormancy-associated protein homolog 3-like isoform X1 [Triticum dicoccoides]